MQQDIHENHDQPADDTTGNRRTTEGTADSGRPARVHSAPRLLPFVLIGCLLGVVAAGLATALGPSSEMYSPGRSFGFLAVMFGFTGLVLGGLVFVLVDGLHQRRRR
ncbi:hypothetical protein [Kytococcus sp. Marseille-QA3725]